MFCPNCGTKNDDSALKCSQCGFDVKPRAAASKHKGTVMFTASPAAAAGAGTKPAPNLKGTMVGVAPPDVTGGASAAPVVPKASSHALKGTMVGVAPPGMEDIRKQAAASQAASASPGVNPSGPAGSVAARSQAAPGPASRLKGTMIGLAPPDMGAEVEAAKAKLAARKAESAQARAAEAAKNTAETGAGAPVAQAATAQAGPSQAATSPASKGPPSQLKGTMIGVAPPDMQAQIAAARELATAKKAKADASVAAAQAAASSIAASAAASVDQEPPSEPDPLGGTMVGMSPFASSAFAQEGASTHAQGTPAPVNFDDNTPPAGTEAPGDDNAGSGIAADVGITGAGIAGAGIAEAGAGSMGAVADFAGASDAGASELGESDSASLRTSTLDQPRIPVTKSSAGPIALIIVLVAIVVGGVMYLLNKKSDESADEAPAAEEAAPDSQAAE